MTVPRVVPWLKTTHAGPGLTTEEVQHGYTNCRSRDINRNAGSLTEETIEAIRRDWPALGRLSDSSMREIYSKL